MHNIFLSSSMYIYLPYLITAELLSYLLLIELYAEYIRLAYTAE